jgi:diguanylate cyclase (GGDEF)-like protein
MSILKSSSDTNQVMKQVGEHLTLQQENQLLRAKIAELEALVVRDTLTPLYNRRHFNDIIDRWIWRAHRYDGNYGLLFIDVNELKQINDTYGHGAGDAVLVAVAKALQSAIRRSDIAARISGDEFALLLENIETEELPDKAERIAKSISQLLIPYEDIKLKVTVSVGYTKIVGNVSASTLLAHADKSMYDMKRASPSNK